MKRVTALLILLISSLTITGVSFLDDQIWNLVFLIVGLLAYWIVGILFSVGVLHGRQSGRDAYVFVLFLLALGAWAVYEGLTAFQRWVVSWPIAAKISVPSALLLIIGLVIFFMVKSSKSPKEEAADSK